MLHVRDTAKAIIPVYRKKGFNGVRVDLSIENPELLEDGQSAEESAAWNENYVCLQADAHIEKFLMDGNQYCSFDEDQFWEDLIADLQRRFGEDVSIDFNENTREIEIQRG